MRWTVLLIMVLLLVPSVLSASQLFETTVDLEINESTVYLTDENDIVREYYIPNENYTKTDSYKIKFYREIETFQNLTPDIKATQNTCSEMVTNTTDRYNELKILLTEQSDYIQLYSDCSAELVNLNRSCEILSKANDNLQICNEDLSYVTNQNNECNEDRNVLNMNVSSSKIKISDLEDENKNLKTQRFIYAVICLVGGIAGYRYFTEKKQLGNRPKEGIVMSVK